MNQAKDKKNKKVFVIISLFNLIVCLGFIIYSVSLFYAGYHSVDQAVNGYIFQERFDYNLYDIGTDFKPYTLDELYINGINHLRAGFYVFGISMFLFALYLFSSLALLTYNGK